MGPLYNEYIDRRADEHHSHRNQRTASIKGDPASKHAARLWIGRKLIEIGERLVPQPSEMRFEPSTGPPCP